MTVHYALDRRVLDTSARLIVFFGAGRVLLKRTQQVLCLQQRDSLKWSRPARWILRLVHRKHGGMGYQQEVARCSLVLRQMGPKGLDIEVRTMQRILLSSSSLKTEFIAGQSQGGRLRIF